MTGPGGASANPLLSRSLRVPRPWSIILTWLARPLSRPSFVRAGVRYKRLSQAVLAAALRVLARVMDAIRRAIVDEPRVFASRVFEKPMRGAFAYINRVARFVIISSKPIQYLTRLRAGDRHRRRFARNNGPESRFLFTGIVVPSFRVLHQVENAIAETNYASCACASQFARILPPMCALLRQVF
ncbi:MAG: Uncharacterised protein [Hyphomonas sp. TMED17]|nr:MAG: Uncharacterised protein [Hyphomonas sp. TMED17]